MPVHHIDMDPVGAGRVHGAHFLAEAREIGGEDGGGDADRLLHRPSLTEARLGGQGKCPTYPRLSAACEPSRVRDAMKKLSAPPSAS